MSIVQQEVLRQAMQIMNFSREQFADHLKLKIRTLNSWLLPENSKGFRRMPSDMMEKVLSAVAVHRKQSVKGNGFVLGTLSEAVPAIYCDKFDFVFPTLYRARILIKGTDLMTGEEDRTKDEIIYDYSLSESPAFNVNNAQLLDIEPVKKRNLAHDFGDIYISEHLSFERAEAYARAFIEIGDDENFEASVFTTLYKFQDRIFRLEMLNMSNKKTFATKYSTDFYWKRNNVNLGDLSFFFECEDGWDIKFKRNELLQVNETNRGEE